MQVDLNYLQRIQGKIENMRRATRMVIITQINRQSRESIGNYLLLLLRKIMIQKEKYCNNKSSDNLKIQEEWETQESQK